MYVNSAIMETKLTLRLNGSVIKKAKLYAKRHNISLSKMIEAYLDSLTRKNEQDDLSKITPLVESLSGLIDLPEDFNYKEKYGDYLNEKYK